jgi:hypothetical protein
LFEDLSILCAAAPIQANTIHLYQHLVVVRKMFDRLGENLLSTLGKIPVTHDEDERE